MVLVAVESGAWKLLRWIWTRDAPLQQHNDTIRTMTCSANPLIVCGLIQGSTDVCS